MTEWEKERDRLKRKWSNIWKRRGYRSGPMRTLLLKGQSNPKMLFEKPPPVDQP